jgi:hypothetical protein
LAGPEMTPAPPFAILWLPQQTRESTNVRLVLVATQYRAAYIKHAIILREADAGSGVGGRIRRSCSRRAASLVIPGDDTSLIDMTTV